MVEDLVAWMAVIAVAVVASTCTDVAPRGADRLTAVSPETTTAAGQTTRLSNVAETRLPHAARLPGGETTRASVPPCLSRGTATLDPLKVVSVATPTTTTTTEREPSCDRVKANPKLFN